MNQWVQNYNPISNVWLSTAVAAIPVVVLFYLLAVKKTHAHRAAIYGFLASVVPVWLLLAPRDYLSTFLKIGVVVGLAIGIYLVQPELRMQSVTRFVDGTGPVFSGPLFPFLFITIACGAVSGFHALISSGTTPKMIERESHARFVGYGGMLMESFVAMMALCAACVLDPGIYFAMNSPAAVIGNTPERAAEVISGWGLRDSAAFPYLWVVTQLGGRVAIPGRPMLIVWSGSAMSWTPRCGRAGCGPRRSGGWSSTPSPPSATGPRSRCASGSSGCRRR
jgi:carbon starvation protein CstA